MNSRRSGSSAELTENVIGGAAVGGIAAGAAGYILSGDTVCRHLPTLLNQSVVPANDTVSLVTQLVNHYGPEIQRLLSLNYLNTHGYHIAGYIDYDIFKNEMREFATKVSSEVIKQSYNLTQNAFTQECLNMLGPTALMRKYAWWGAIAGAGLGLGVAVASYMQSREQVYQQDKKSDDVIADEQQHVMEQIVEETVLAPQSEIDKAVSGAIDKKIPQLAEDATSKAVAASLLQANSLFKRRQELLMMNKRYHESTNIHKTYGI